MADWAELPSDIVELITSLLPLTDYLRFGATCRPWSSIVAERHFPAAHQLPWLVLGEDITTKSRKLYNFSEQKLHHIEIPEAHARHCSSSCGGWLVTVNKKLDIDLLNPISRTRIPLPALQHSTPPSDMDESLYEEVHCMHIYKIVLSADPGMSSDYRVATIYGECRRLACWKPGDVGWTKMNAIMTCCHDAIWYKGVLYVVTWSNEVFSFDFQAFPPKAKQMVDRDVSLDGNRSYSTRYLVDFMGDLLLVARDAWGVDYDPPHLTTRVAVYKLENTAGKWIKLESIGDYALFLGRSSPIIVSARDFPGCRRDSIYFTDDFEGRQTYGCEDLVIYSLKGGIIEPHCPAGVVDGSIFRPLWLLPNVC